MSARDDYPTLNGMERGGSEESRQALDEIDGLRVTVEMQTENIEGFEAQWAEIVARLPDCPTCGGTGEAFIGEPHHLPDCDCLWDETPCAQTFGPCPDCDHGKVTVAQMAALWQAVWDPMYHTCCLNVPATWAGAFDHLRAIR